MRLKKAFSLRAAAIAVLCAVAVAMLAVLTGCQQQEANGSKSDEIVSEASDVKIQEPFYALLVGNDSRTGTVEISKSEYADGNARSDTMILARIDPLTYTVTLITVPRDTAASVDGSTTKINAAYQSGGIEASVDQVEQLTGAQIDYYFDLGFVTFQKFIDAMGGVSVDVPISMEMQDIVGGDDISVDAGTQDLNGAEALVVARTRKAFATDQDACRQIQDRAIVASVIGEVAQDASMVDMAVTALMDNAQTNMNADELKELVSSFAQHADQLTIYTATGPYAGDIDAGSGLWLAIRDEETWHQIIEVADAGEDPSGIVALPQIIPA